MKDDWRLLAGLKQALEPPNWRPVSEMTVRDLLAELADVRERETQLLDGLAMYALSQATKP